MWEDQKNAQTHKKNHNQAMHVSIHVKKKKYI